MYSKVVLPISVIVLTVAAACASEVSTPSSAPAQKEYVVYNTTRMTFWGAWRICHSRGQRLATVMSATDSELLQRTIEQTGVSGERHWIGATDEGSEGDWIWIGTSTVIDHETGYTNWGNDQPNDDESSENCAQVGPEGDVTWNDASCQDLLPFICERDRSDLLRQILGTNLLDSPILDWQM